MPGPPNGDLAAGLTGWEVQGRDAPAPPPSGRGIRLRGNTTLVSPPLAVPAGAQALMVTAASPSGEAILEVRARPAEGGAEVPLGVLEPGAVPRPAAVAIAPLAGRTVRVVLDPVPALGASLDVVRVGPVLAPIAGWRVVRGAPRPAGRGRARALRASGGPLELVSPRFDPGPAARELIVSVRGDGVLRLAAGARPRAARAGTGWRDVRVRLPTGRRAALRLLARPGAGGLELRDLGLVRREVRLGGLRVGRAGGRVVVRARLGVAGGGLRVELRGRGGARLAAARSDRAGRVRLAAAARRRPSLVVVVGDRTRIGARRQIR